GRLGGLSFGENCLRDQSNLGPRNCLSSACKYLHCNTLRLLKLADWCTNSTLEFPTDVQRSHNVLLLCQMEVMISEDGCGELGGERADQQVGLDGMGPTLGIRAMGDAQTGDHGHVDVLALVLLVGSQPGPKCGEVQPVRRGDRQVETLQE